MQQKIIRKFTRRVYDNYTLENFSSTMDNLNPVNPTVLESQFDEMLHTVKDRVINNYEKAKIQPPDDLFDSDGVDPHSLLSAIDDLISSIKGNENPLVDLSNMGLLDLTPFLTAPNTASSIMDNPLSMALDCNGITKTLLGESDIEGDDDDDDNDKDKDGSGSGHGSTGNAVDGDPFGNGQLGGVFNPGDVYGGDGTGVGGYKITYEVSNGKNSSLNPFKYLPEECPITIQPAEANDGYVFKGWYLDFFFNELLVDNKIKNREGDITLYANIIAEEDDRPEDDENEDADAGGGLNGAEDDGDGCDLIELTWLKIIMIIMIIVQIIIKILVLICNIMKAAADIAKDAQLCWINPPSLQSLISYVMQRLSAIIFQLLGMILMKIWALLNLDCVVASVNDMVDQINAILSGMGSIMGQVDALALDLGKPGTGIGTAIKNLKDQLVKQFEDFRDAWSAESLKKQLQESLAGIVSDYRALFTNPALLYESTVPPEIREKIQSLMDSYNAVQTQIESMGKQFNSMMNSVHKLQNGDAKNIITKVFL